MSGPRPPACSGGRTRSRAGKTSTPPASSKIALTPLLTPALYAAGRRPASAACVPAWPGLAAGAGRDQAALVGVDHGLDPVPQPELLQDPGHVGLGRGFADDQLAADLRVGQAPDEQV